MRELTGRVIRGGLWLVAVRTTGQLGGLARVVVLARILAPREFGLFGVAIVVLSLFETLATTGIQAALLQRQERVRAAFDTAWTLGCLRGVLLAALMAMSAPTVAVFFDSPEATTLVWAMALIPLVTGLGNVAVVEFNRTLAFAPHYVLNAAGVVADLAVAIPFALWLGNAWALVAGTVAMAVTRHGLSYAVHPYRPRLRIDRQELGALLGYGWWVFGSTLAGWGLQHGASAVVGRLAGVQALAFYQVGWRLATAVTTEVTNAMSGVTTAAYARLQGDRTRVGQAYFRVLSLVTLVTVPVAIGVVVHGPGLAPVILGPGWGAVVPIVQVLALSGLARALGATAAPVFLGTGHPRLETAAVLVELGVLAATVWPLTAGFGPVGAALSAMLASAAGAVAALGAVLRLLGLPGRRLGPILGWPALACVPVVATQLGLVGAQATPVGLVAAAALSAAMYIGGLAVLQRLGLYSVDAALVEPVRQWAAGWTCRGLRRRGGRAGP